jgi:hypothetical protein
MEAYSVLNPYKRRPNIMNFKELADQNENGLLSKEDFSMLILNFLLKKNIQLKKLANA